MKFALGAYTEAGSIAADAAGDMNGVMTTFRDEGVAAAKNGGDEVKQSHDEITRVMVRTERAAVRRRVFEGEGYVIVSLIVLTLCPMFMSGECCVQWDNVLLDSCRVKALF